MTHFLHKPFLFTKKQMANYKPFAALLLLFFFAGIFNIAHAGVITSTTDGGNWSDGTTWVGGIAPVAGDDVIIATTGSGIVTVNVATASLASLVVNNGAKLVVSETLTCTNLTVGNGISGILEYNAGNTGTTITVNGGILINAGARVSGGLTGTAVNAISIAGNFTNNGLFYGATYGGGPSRINVTFTGASSNVFTSAAGSNSTFNAIIIDKGTDNANILDFNPASSVTLRPALLTLLNGTFKISGSRALSNAFFSSPTYTIGATAGFWLNNPNVTVTAQAGDATLNGLLRISAGTFNMGNTNAFVMLGSAATSTLIVEGGSLNVSARLQLANPASTFTMSGGTLNAATVGNNATSSASFAAAGAFNMSGGTITLAVPSSATPALDYDVSSASPAITGGSLQIATATTGAGANFKIRGVTPNLVLSNSSTNNPAITQTETVTVHGDITLDGSGSYDMATYGLTMAGMNGTHPGNITINGTNSINNSGAGAILNWTGTNGLQTLSGSGSVSLQNMLVNNVSSINVSNPITVAGTLNLINGIINNGSNTITITNTATNAVTGGTATSYINGTLERSQNTTASASYFYPVGDASHFNPVRIINGTTVAASNSFSVNYLHNAYSTLAPTNPAYHTSALEYWNINRTNAATDAMDIALITSSDAASAIVDRSSVEVGHFNGTTWDELGNNAANASFGATGSEIYTTGVTSFSPFTYMSASVLNTLPVQWQAFTATVVNNTAVKLSWKTNTETNNDYFTAQKSVDGIRWNNLITVKGSGTSSKANEYTASDNNPYNGVSYYRIQQTDVDGKYTYSEIRKVSITEQSTLSIYPNPASDNIIIKGVATELNNVRVINAAGVDVTKYVQVVERSGTKLVLNISGISKGVYIVTIGNTPKLIVKQ